MFSVERICPIAEFIMSDRHFSMRICETALFLLPIWNLTIFSILQNGGSRHLGFLEFRIFNCRRVKRVKLHHHAKFCGDRSNRCWEMAIFWFYPLKWRPTTILDLWCAFGPPTKGIWYSLSLCAKFGCNWCSNFDNKQVLIFCDSGLKAPIYAPKLGFGKNKRTEGVVLCSPQRTRSYVWGLLSLCHFWRKSIKKCDRESADRQTDGHTMGQKQTEFVNCPMLCYSCGADKMVSTVIRPITSKNLQESRSYRKLTSPPISTLFYYRERLSR